MRRGCRQRAADGMRAGQARPASSGLAARDGLHPARAERHGRPARNGRRRGRDRRSLHRQFYNLVGDWCRIGRMASRHWRNLVVSRLRGRVLDRFFSGDLERERRRRGRFQRVSRVDLVGLRRGLGCLLCGCYLVGERIGYRATSVSSFSESSGIWNLVSDLQVENANLQAENDRLSAEIDPVIVKARLIRPFANRVFWFLNCYTIAVFTVLLLCRFKAGGFSLSDSVLLALAGTSFVSVGGSIGAIVTGLFSGK